MLTGLRKGELASITIGSLHLDTKTPFIELAAANEKARRGADVPLRGDLAEDLRSWLADRLKDAQARARTCGEPVPLKLDPSAMLFDVPQRLFRILDRDLVAADIARLVKGPDGTTQIDKRDERGRTIDVHALRHTFGTLLSKGGVTLRTAQAAMRHSDPGLTANVYTDPKLLDVHGALDALPPLPLDPAPKRQRATGTAGSGREFVLGFVLTPDQSSTNQSNAGSPTTGAEFGALTAGSTQVSPPSTLGAACQPVTGGSSKAGDRDRTGDIQLGKLTFYR